MSDTPALHACDRDAGRKRCTCGENWFQQWDIGCTNYGYVETDHRDGVDFYSEDSRHDNGGEESMHTGAAVCTGCGASFDSSGTYVGHEEHTHPWDAEALLLMRRRAIGRAVLNRFEAALESGEPINGGDLVDVVAEAYARP